MVDDGSWPDWTFLGADNEGFTGPENCEEIDPVIPGVQNLSCAADADGEITVEWRNPAIDPNDEPISIGVNGEEVTTVGGDETSVVIAPDQIPAGAVVCVTNASGFAQCCAAPLGISCSKNDDGSLLLSWQNPADKDPGEEITILANNEEIKTIAGDQTSVTLAVGEFPDEGIVRFCVDNGALIPPCCTIAVSNVLRINMGGEETIDSQGRLWLGDRPCGLAANTDTLGIRPNLAGGTNAICDWCAPEPFSMEELDLDPFDPGDLHIFSTIRWDVGGDADDFYVELPVENGVYDINFNFSECCCTGRHFKIEVEGAIEYADVSYLEYDVDPALGKVGMLEVLKAQVSDGSLTIGFLPCPECPGVSDVNAIKISVTNDSSRPEASTTSGASQ